MKNILVTITGPSLTGKSRLAELLTPNGFEEIVSTTTRPARKGEIEGVHYNFVSVDDFKTLIDNEMLLEKVVVGKNFYGVSKPAFEKIISKDLNGVAVVEPDGARQVAEYCKKNNIMLHQVFINNPTNILVSRFLKRYKNDTLAQDEVYATRIIDMLQKEPKEWIEPAYSGKDMYDQIFSSFTIENETDVVNQIRMAVELKNNANKKVRL